MKTYNIMNNVGSVKYLVNYHNGLKTYPDGSPFFDIATFSNKKKLRKFEKELLTEGYQYKH